jgi:hypothetical protein
MNHVPLPDSFSLVVVTLQNKLNAAVAVELGGFEANPLADIKTELAAPSDDSSVAAKAVEKKKTTTTGAHCYMCSCRCPVSHYLLPYMCCSTTTDTSLNTVAGKAEKKTNLRESTGVQSASCLRSSTLRYGAAAFAAGHCRTSLPHMCCPLALPHMSCATKQQLAAIATDSLLLLITWPVSAPAAILPIALLPVLWGCPPIAAPQTEQKAQTTQKKKSKQDASVKSTTEESIPGGADSGATFDVEGSVGSPTATFDVEGSVGSPTTSKLQRGAAKGAQGSLSPQQLRLLARFPRKAIPPTQLFFFFLVFFFWTTCSTVVTRSRGVWLWVSYQRSR